LGPRRPVTASCYICCAGLAEFGSEQLEFIKLSDWTGNATYARLAEGNVALLHDKYPDRVRTWRGQAAALGRGRSPAAHRCIR
jgi:Glycosyl hydrolase family 47